MSGSTYPAHAILIPDASNTSKGAVELAGSLGGSAANPLLCATPVPLTDGASIPVDASLGNLFSVTLGGSRTMAAPTNPSKGQRIAFRIKQDATGSRTMSWDAIYRFCTSIASPTLSTTASKTDYVEFIYNSDSLKWDVVDVRLGY